MGIGSGRRRTDRESLLEKIRKKMKNNQLCFNGSEWDKKVSKVRGTRKAYLDKGGSLAGWVFRSDKEPSKAGEIKIQGFMANRGGLSFKQA